ncbi:MAG: flagellar basal body L-ring protein FlgH [Proteobacteria bacterium]|nr:flagellar basal body L-ring protein FlgH [Pseudomonadota bacterium]
MKKYFVAFLLLSGCGPSHVANYTPKRRNYDLPASSDTQNGSKAQGSLWTNSSAAGTLFSDQRALRENDLVTVKIEEVANANRSADTNVRRNAELEAKLGAFLKANGIIVGPQVELNGNTGLGVGFDYSGATGRTEQLTATVPAIVRKILPNGNLFIEGHRVVLVNSEEQHFYISGVVRPIDIDQSNSVKSSMIADAEIEFTGRGVLTDNQQQGVVARFFSWLWPF